MNDILGTSQLLLASKSPRRSTLLESAGIPFKVIKCDWDEVYDPEMSVHSIPQFLAYQKALFVKDQLSKNNIILTADTVVVQNGKLLGKPEDKGDAIKTLTSLSNKSHTVITGTTFMSDSKIINTSCSSTVEFCELSNKEIMNYVEEDAPFDKAGSYGIQDWIGICKIKSIKGSYHNVMGLPTHIVYSVLKSWK